MSSNLHKNVSNEEYLAALRAEEELQGMLRDNASPLAQKMLAARREFLERNGRFLTMEEVLAEARGCECAKSEVITTSFEVMGGTPVFRGTRVPLQTLFDYLKAGETIDDFLEGFPTVSREQVITVLEEANEQLQGTAA